MADLVITAANVLASSDVTKKTVTAGETITAGQVVYLQTSDNKYYKSDADATNKKSCAGIALCGATANQPVVIADITRNGNMALGATLIAGMPYCVSTTAGGIRPIGDVATGDEVIIIGIATATSNIKLQLLDADVAIGTGID